MLAPISGTRRDGRTSFRALKNYLAYKKDPITGEQISRGCLVLSDNLLSEQTLQAEMRAVAGENTRVKDPVFHYQLCWQEGEEPTDKQWKEAAQQTIHNLGFAEHQYVIAPHKDTDHFHVHVMVNRVHPETYKAHYPEFSKRTLDKALREIETRQHWKESKGLFRWDVTTRRAVQNTPADMEAQRTSGAEEKTRHRAASKVEHFADAESLYAYARREPAKQLKEVLKDPDADWQVVHRALAVYGLELDKGDKGGFTVRAIDSELRVKASSVFRETFAGKENRARIERLGAWEVRGELAVPEMTARYSARPIKRDPSERAERREQRAGERRELHDRYAAYRRVAQVAYQAESRLSQEAFRAITQEGKAQRQILMGGGLSVAERKGRRSLIAFEVASKREAAQLDHRQRMAGLPPKSYRSWVEDQAASLDAAALAQLRGFLYGDSRKKKHTGIVAEITAPDPNAQVYASVLKSLQWEFDRRTGDVTYFIHGSKAILDRGQTLNLLNTQQDTCVTALGLAQAKFGNRLHVTGSDAVKAAIVEAAVRANLRIEFTDARMNEQMTAAARAAISGQKVVMPLREEVAPQKADAPSKSTMPELGKLMGRVKQAWRSLIYEPVSEVPSKQSHSLSERISNLALLQAKLNAERSNESGAAPRKDVVAQKPGPHSEEIAVKLSEQQVRRLLADKLPNDLRAQTRALHHILIEQETVSILDGKVILGYREHQGIFFAALQRIDKSRLDEKLRELEPKQHALKQKQQISREDRERD